jgi:carbonic anhydrase/acetyltransferase-like protein (isoleucine patch superfamily)
MTQLALDGLAPKLPANDNFWIAPDAQVIGNVELKSAVSVWFGAVIRGDNEPILVGAGSNIQDLCVLHTDIGCPLSIGENCTIGHRVILHGCSIGNNCLIGMGAIIMNGAVIGNNCLIGAGAIVTEGKAIPDGSLVIGAPGKVVRHLDQAEIDSIANSAAGYWKNGQRFAAGLTQTLAARSK